LSFLSKTYYIYSDLLEDMESTQQSQAVTITNKAAEKVAEFMKQEGNTGL
jgi:hypothetical protein